MSKIPIVFFGSGPVAAKSLDLLLPTFDIVAVVTKPKPDHYRGSFPVLDICEKNGLKVYPVSSKSDVNGLIKTKPFETEVAVLIDFGIIVSQDVIDYFPKGIVNSHFSLLPEWRGADPITFAILSGQAKTGVSLMLLTAAMDEGPVIACGVQELNGTETAPKLTDSLIRLSHALLTQELPRYMHSEISGTNQLTLASQIPDYPSTPTYSRKLSKTDGILDFTKPAKVLEREIRGFIEWPKSTTKLANIDVIVTSALVDDSIGEIGEVRVHDAGITICCSEGGLVLREVRPAGKKTMPIAAFIAGYGRYLN